jgi:pimeloyl-ACP methyl ester carboxylesterase
MGVRHSETVRLPLLGGGALQVCLSFQDARQDFALTYVHGFGSTRCGEKAVALEASCARRGWTFVSFDFRGHGQSSGTLLDLRGTLLLEDIGAVRDYLVGRGIPKLCPVGSSMGGWAAAWFALRHPQSVPACVLIAPAIDFLQSRWTLLTETERRRWRETGRLRVKSEWVDADVGYGLAEERDLFPAERLRTELACPVLIFHGMKDDVVSFRHSLALAENLAHPGLELRLFAGGDHRLLSFADEMAEESCRFFAKVLALAPSVREA